MFFYAGLVLALVLTLSLLYYNYTSSILVERASQSLLQLSTTTNNNLDTLIKNLDSTAYRIVSSSLIKEAFYKSNSNTLELLENKRNMMQLLFTTTGSKIDNPINIIGTTGKIVEFGKNFDVSYPHISTQKEIEFQIRNCLEAEGNMYISNTPLFASKDSQNMVFSVCRSFNETFGAPYNACVEVQLNYDTIAKLLDSSIGDEDITIYVYDKFGNLIYPQSASSKLPDYYHLAEDIHETSGTFTLKPDKHEQIVTFSKSAYSGITVFSCENKAQLYLPVVGFRNALFGVAALILLFTTFIVSLLANQLTRPIHTLQKSINSLDLNNLDSTKLPCNKYSTYELENLNETYKKMILRLESSLNEAVTAHSHEIEARMLALQAQMNPHFLYNTITIISIQAEDYQADKVVEMCENLSSMLRYVTKETNGTVSLDREIEHLKQYLFLMACRYPEQFTANISIPPEMEKLAVPKLIIQPLIENSFKHGFQTNKHWEINLEGSIDETHWEIKVTDNGIGFSEDALKQLTQNFSDIQGDFENEEHDNVGLSNIFHRLKFLYKTDAKFQIENLTSGGCCITIGGGLKNELQGNRSRR